jgi:hypothetical protein
MKRFISISLSLFVVFGLLLATERRAMAYVDPGSGLLAIQSAGAALAAVGYYMRRRILALFGKKKPAEEAALPVQVQKGSTRNAA